MPTATFANIPISAIRTDCRHYSGYKPCKKHDGCPDCPHHAPRGEQILIIKLGAMGDVLRTKSLLPALKRAHPTSWIVWLTNPGSEALARDPLVDEVRAFTLEGITALEGRRFARLLCLDKDAHAVALSARLEADVRQGFAPTAYNTITVWNDASAEALRLGLSDELKYRISRKTVPRILHDMAELDYDGCDYGLTLGDAARAEAADLVARLGLPKGRRIVGVNTGCGPVFETKAWTRDGFAELLASLGRRDDVAMLLLGGPREEALHAELMRRAGDMAGRVVFDAGNHNPLERFFAVVERCDVVLSSDSLAMHVAIALKRPVVAFFGPTCAHEVDLFGRGEAIVTDFSCSPCYLKRCDKQPTCMQAMSAGTVEAAVLRVLGRAG